MQLYLNLKKFTGGGDDKYIIIDSNSNNTKMLYKYGDTIKNSSIDGNKYLDHISEWSYKLCF